MSKIQLFLLFALITFSLSLHKKNLKKNKGFFCKRKLGEGCNWLHCCGDKDSTCDDYVCVLKNISKINAQVKWAPEGPKCNWLHGCKNDSLKCDNWRCVPKEPKPQEQGVITTAVKAVKNFFTGNSTKSNTTTTANKTTA